MIISSEYIKKGEIKEYALGGRAYYDSVTYTLTLNNIISTENFSFSETHTIELIGENKVNGMTNVNVKAKGNPLLTIKGKGELLLTGYINIGRLLVEDCTLYIKNPSHFMSRIKQLEVKNANMILPNHYVLNLTKNNIRLQGCSIVQDNFNFMIIQKDKKT